MPNFTKLTTQSELPPADEAKEFPCGAKNYLRRQCERRLQRHGQRVPASRRPAGARNDREAARWCVPGTAGRGITKTGAGRQNPSMKVAVYPLKIENGDVLIEI
jgi:hypothetical protein